MTTVRDIEKRLYDWAPKALALEWDNVGLLVGDGASEVHRVLVSLDITEDVAAEAARIGADLIVAHHPLMNCAWHRVQHVTADDARAGSSRLCCAAAFPPSVCIPIWMQRRAA